MTADMLPEPAVTNGEAQGLRERIDAFPNQLRAGVARGARVWPRLTNDQHTRVVAATKLFVAHPNAVDGVELAKELAVKPRQALDVVYLGFFLTAFVATSDEPADVARISAEVGIVDAADVAAVANCLTELRKEKDDFQRQHFAEHTLPSFEFLDTSVDVRCIVRNGAVSSTVPVIVARLDTDADERIAFQLSKGQLLGLLRTLNAALAEVEAVERWLADRPRNNGE